MDFHKAYDSLSWCFLEWVLKQINFRDLWCDWIITCISTASVSILINGSPCSPFKLRRGLRQGDPLSPFLFILIDDTLNQIITKATSLSMWISIRIRHGDLKITHLQYANDTLIFCDANIESLKDIKKALILFQLATGLQIKFFKSSLIGLNTSSMWLQSTANTLLCKVRRNPLHLSRVAYWWESFENSSMGPNHIKAFQETCNMEKYDALNWR